MPDKDGKLSADEQAIARKWIEEHWKNWACPFSGDTNWNLGEYLAEARAFVGGGLVVGGIVYPCVVVSCGGCGHTVFLNAIQIGIVKRQEGEYATTKPS